MNIVKVELEEKPLTVLVYGPDGMGKTTFASKFPKTLFLGPEISGADFIEGVHKDLDSTTYAGVMNTLDELLESPDHGFETICIDSLDHIELDIHSMIKKKYKVDNLSKAAGGYGAGFKEAAEMQYDLKNKVVLLRETQKINIILLAHSQVRPFNDPLTDIPYDRYELKLHESASVSPRAMWRESVDAVFFLNEEISMVGEGKNVRARSSKVKYLYTRRSPRYDAKCRFVVPERIPFKLENDIYFILTEFAYSKNSPFDECMQLYSGMKNKDEKILKAIEAAKGDDVKLKKMKIRLKELA